MKAVYSPWQSSPAQPACVYEQEVTLFLRVLGCYPVTSSPRAPECAKPPASRADGGYAGGVTGVLNGSNALALRMALGSVQTPGQARSLSSRLCVAPRPASACADLRGRALKRAAPGTAYQARVNVLTCVARARSMCMLSSMCSSSDILG